jgi:hypothetical protein
MLPASLAVDLIHDAPAGHGLYPDLLMDIEEWQRHRAGFDAVCFE